MDKKSSSIIRDVVGTFAAVSVVAYLLSLTLDEPTSQPLAQSLVTHQSAVVTVANFSSQFSTNNYANVDVNQFEDCKVVGINQAKALLTLDCSSGQVNGLNGSINSGVLNAKGGQQI